MFCKGISSGRILVLVGPLFVASVFRSGLSCSLLAKILLKSVRLFLSQLYGQGSIRTDITIQRYCSCEDHVAPSVFRAYVGPEEGQSSCNSTGVPY